ncbi:MAG: flavin reductase family protein [Candidatus Krumholzibacteria bacterium]
MIIDPAKVTAKECYKLMVGSIVPRPIAFVSTVSGDGSVNLAPFSYFTAITSAPPTVCFAPGRRSRDGDRKDTLSNIEATGEFVVNVVTEAIGAAMHETAGEFPADVDEFEVVGLTREPSRIVKPPRVKESPINMECRVYDIIHIGGDKPTGGSLVIGEIVLFHIEDDLYDAGRIDIQKLNPLGRLAGDDYTALGRIISHRRKKL